jgi:hypothetical protein
VLAAVLGILAALGVAFQWLLLDRRVDERVQTHRDALEESLRGMVRQYLASLGTLAVNWMQPLGAIEPHAERIWQRTPDLPNLAPLMAGRYLDALGEAWNPEGPDGDAPGRLTPDGQNLLNAARKWATRAYDGRAHHEPGWAAWLQAEVAAWTKDGSACIQYLAEAQNARVPLHQWVRDDPNAWRVLTSCTHGRDKDLILLDEVLALLGYRRPPFDAVRAHCEELGFANRSIVWGISRTTGNAERIVVQHIERAVGEWAWELMRPHSGAQPGPTDASFAAVMDYVLRTWIPTRLVRQRAISAANGLIIGASPEEDVPDGVL